MNLYDRIKPGKRRRGWGGAVFLAAACVVLAICIGTIGWAARCWTCGKRKYPKRPPKTPPAFLCVIPLPMERFTNMTRTRSK